MNENVSTIQSRAPMTELVDRIVRRFDPLQIILFGSHARNQADSGSDVDLLVVLDAVENRHATTANIIRETSDVAPVDIVATDPLELRRRGDLVGDVLKSALNDGVVIYER